MFSISDLPLGAGWAGLCPMPGRTGDYAGDLAQLLAWHPAMVVTMTTDLELEAVGADRLPADLRRDGIIWRHVPVTDFGAPCAASAAEWQVVSREARAVLAEGGRVLVHCYGGCGRSGMALLRLMVECGEDREAALARLRAVRPGAVETAGQARWASRACEPEAVSAL